MSKGEKKKNLVHNKTKKKKLRKAKKKISPKNKK